MSEHLRDPAQHEAHERSLADRIVTRAICDFIKIGCEIARAGAGTATPEERAKQAMIDEMQYLHFDGVYYTLTPRILDELRRAGLLRENTAEAGAEPEPR